MNQRPNEQPAIRVTAMPADANFNGDIFGGWIMSMMDLAAGNVASRRSRGRAVTAAVDAVNFRHPVNIGDELSIYAKVTSMGRTSVKIPAESWQRARDGDSTFRVTQAIFTLVAIDHEGRPRPVPRDGGAT